MNRSVYEGRYLVNMLGAVIRQDDSYPKQKKMDWERMFRLSDYHDIASAIYLSMMGTSQRVPEKWGERFFNRYQESVRYGRVYEEAEKEILMVLNVQKLSGIVLESSAIRRLYRIPETASKSPLRLFFTEENYHIAKGYLIDIGYLTDKFYDGYGDHMRKNGGFEVEIYYKLPFMPKTFQQNMDALMDRAYPDKRYESLKVLSLESSFVFRMAEASYLYCTDSLKIRTILNYYLFYSQFKDKLNQKFLEARFREFAITDLADSLITIADMWFGPRGKNLFDKPREDLGIYDEIETRILSNGTAGTDSLPEVLQLKKQIQQILDEEAKEERKKQRKQKIKDFFLSIGKGFRWVFPGYKYMRSLYPILTYLPILLPLFWLIRGLHMLWIEIKLTFTGKRKKEEEKEEELAAESLQAVTPRQSYTGTRERKKVFYKPKDGKAKPSVEIVGAHGASKVVSGDALLNAEEDRQTGSRLSGKAEEKSFGRGLDNGKLSDTNAGIYTAADTDINFDTDTDTDTGTAATYGTGAANGSSTGIGVVSGNATVSDNNSNDEETYWEFPRIPTVRYTMPEPGSNRSESLNNGDGESGETSETNTSSSAFGGGRVAPVFPRVSIDEAEAGTAMHGRGTGGRTTGGNMNASLSANASTRRTVGNRIIHQDDMESEKVTLNGKEVNVSKWKFPTIEEVEEGSPFD